MNKVVRRYLEGRFPEVREHSLCRQDGDVAKRARRDAVAVDRVYGLPVRFAADGRRATRLQCGVQRAAGRSTHARIAATTLAVMRMTGVVVRRR